MNTLLSGLVHGALEANNSKVAREYDATKNRWKIKTHFTTAERDAIQNPGADLIIFNTDTSVENRYDGTRWLSGTENSPPVAITFSDTDVSVLAKPGDVVCVMAALDANVGDTVTFSLLTDPSGNFTVSGNQILVSNTAEFSTGQTFPITVRATDSSSATLDVDVTITVVTLTIGPPLSTLTSGDPIPSVTAEGGTAPYTFTASGNIPAGVSINSNGSWTGTTTTPGAYAFNVTATDAHGNSGTASFGVTVQSAGFTVSAPASADWTSGVALSFQFTSNNGVLPVSFAVSSGSLPPGVTLDASTGVISGTPSAAGAYNVVVSATDATGAQDETDYVLTIAPAIAISASSTPSGYTNTSYALQIVTSDGRAPVSFSISAGALPAGVSIDAGTGLISGIPTLAGSYTFTVRAIDASGSVATQSRTITIINALSIATAALPNGAIGSAYSATVASTGGTAPVTFSVVSGTLPAGLSLNASTGVLSGTPTTAGTYAFTIRATDAAGATADKAYSVTASATLTIITSTLPNAAQGAAYTTTIAVANASGSVTFSLTAGELPTGLSINASTGVISGTPTVAGNFGFTITASDTSNTVSKAYVATVTSSLSITTTALTGTNYATKPYSATITSSGGVAPIAFSVVAGALPAGVTLNASTGVLSGTPTTAGTYAFTIRATDAAGATADKALSIVISAVPTITLATIVSGKRAVAYSDAVSASGGTAAYSYELTSGSLPPGLALNATTGALTGTPSLSGTYAFTIRATDANGFQGSRAYSLIIAKNLVSTYIGVDGSPTSISGTAITWTGVPISTAHSRRFVVIGLTYTAVNTANATPASVTIGGVTATRLSSAVSGGSLMKVYSAIYCALVPTGTTATVSVTLQSGAYHPYYTEAAISIFTAVDITDHTAYSADNAAGTTVMNGTIAIVNPCLVFGVAGNLDAVARSPAWSLLTRRNAPSIPVGTSYLTHSGASTATITTTDPSFDIVLNWGGSTSLTSAAWAVLN